LGGAALDELDREWVWGEQPADAPAGEGYCGLGVGDKLHAGCFQVGDGLFEVLAHITQVVEPAAAAYGCGKLAGRPIRRDELQVGPVAGKTQKLDVGSLERVVQETGFGYVAEALEVALGDGLKQLDGVADVMEGKGGGHGAALILRRLSLPGFVRSACCEC
jgi:hypothetical protein